MWGGLRDCDFPFPLLKVRHHHNAVVISGAQALVKNMWNLYGQVLKENNFPVRMSRINVKVLIITALPHSPLCASCHRPSSLILVRLFTHGRRSPTECLLIASVSSCWSMSCTLWCLRLCATAATRSLPSSSGQQQIRRLSDRVPGMSRMPK